MFLKNKFYAFIIFSLLLICAAAGAFVLGKNAAETKFRAERELTIQLNRAELETLNIGDGPIYVIGHKAPDSDTVCSAIAYAYLLKQLGYDAQAAVQGPINHETEYILKTAGVETPPLLEETAGKNIVLVDHSEYSQSADDLEDANIISIIDHHVAGTVTTGNQVIYDARPLGGTTTVIWLRFRNYGIEIPKDIAVLLLGGFLSDTGNMKSKTTTSADREAYKILSRTAGITDTEAFYQEMYKASLAYDGMTDEEIYISDLKIYEAGGRKYAIGVVNAYDESIAEDLANRMKALLPSQKAALGVDFCFAQISIFHDDVSITYIVGGDAAANDVVEAAFPDQPVFDGTSFVFNPGMSRKQVLVPAITAVLESHPSE